MSALFNIPIHSSLRSYEVLIGHGIARAVLETPDILVVVDAALPDMHTWLSHPCCIPLHALEDSKNLLTVTKVVECMRDMGANRKSMLVVVGGGIIQDLATFTASSYMRGIEWIYCPTTLLGMVDSCIGGKSSLNVGRYKNLVGNFYPPIRVLIDTDFCNSLPVVQKIEGLCEAVKICYASRDVEFEQYLSIASELDILSHLTTYDEVIALCLQTKKIFIEADEFDQGDRLLLNFGHTFGHAIEGASSYGISHGVAVGLGMLCAARLSQSWGLTEAGQPRLSLLVKYLYTLLSRVPNLIQLLSGISSAEALRCFLSDKKHDSGKFVLILINQSGYLERHFVTTSAENQTLIAGVFDWIRTELKYEIQ